MSVAPTGFLGWIANYGQFVAFFVQIVFYLLVGTSAIWAAITFNRYVTIMTEGDGRSRASRQAAEPIDVDKFVE